MLTFIFSAYLFVGAFILVACIYSFYSAKTDNALTEDELLEAHTLEFWVYTTLNCLFVDPALLIVKGISRLSNGHKE